MDVPTALDEYVTLRQPPKESEKVPCASGSRNLPQPQKLRPNSDRNIAWALVLADWLEELAVFAHPEYLQDAEVAHHMAQSLRHRYLWQLGLPSGRGGPKSSLLRTLDEY